MKAHESACVVLPVLNEGTNLEVLLPELSRFDVIVIDDGSTDSTQDVCSRFENVRILERGMKMGLVSAVLDGFREGRLNFDYFIVADADLSHEPRFIEPMLKLALDSGADLVIGSRYVKGGKSNDDFRRRIISRGANAIFKLAFSRKVKDATSGFRIYSRKAVDFILDSDSDSPVSNSYAGQIDILQRIISHKFKVVEYPISFTPRKKGKSKLGTSDMREYAYLSFRKGHMIRYAAVAGAGLFINQSIISLSALMHSISLSFAMLQSAIIFGLFLGRHHSSGSFREGGLKKGIVEKLPRYTFSAAFAIIVEVVVFVLLMSRGIAVPLSETIGMACALGATYILMP